LRYDHSVDLGDVRQYTERDWEAGSASSPPVDHSPEQALSAVDAARKLIQAASPHWPGAEARAEDLAHHVRLAALFSRASR
jgi:hypothetical protein